MDFAPVFKEILVLFIIIFVGFVLKKKGLIDNRLNSGLSELLINLTLPALIISSMYVEIDSEIIVNIQIITLITIGVYLLTIVLSNLLVKVLPLPEDKKNIFIFMIVFGNVGYMGYPVLGVIYPEYGIFYGLFNNITFNVLLWTYGMYLFQSDRKNYSVNPKNLINSGVVAILIGFFLLLTGIRIPGPILGAIDQLGDMTFPLSMLIIGSSLAGIKIKNIITSKPIFMLTTVKLLFVPLIILLLLRPFNIPDIVAHVTILLTAMPCAANSVVFAKKFNKDNQFAAQGVFVTTLLSMATIPLFLILLG